MAASYPPGFISTQPGAPPPPPGAVVVPPLAPIEGVPQGLEYLAVVDRLILQKVKSFGCVPAKLYSIQNANGDQVYSAAEDSEQCERDCYTTDRGFDIHIYDNFKQRVMTVSRPYNLWAGCIPSIDGCAHELVVRTPSGVVLGSVIQRDSACSYDFYVRDEFGQNIFKIDGENFSFSNARNYFVTSLGGQEIGCILKHSKACSVDEDSLHVNFRIDLPSKIKALIIGATFLIDFMPN